MNNLLDYKRLKYLFYLAATLGLVLLLGSLLRPVFAPLVLSTILALVILPMVKWLEGLGLNRLLSCLIPVVTTAIVVLALGTMAAFQLRELNTSAGSFEKSFFEKVNRLSQYLPEGIKPPVMRNTEDLDKIMPEDMGMVGSFLSDFISATGGVLTTMSLLPIFIFFILFYRNRVNLFLGSLDSKISSEFRKTISQSKSMIQRYLSGLGLVVLINATLATIGLWAFGISYALLLGVLSAVLTVIPYIGTFIGALIPVLFAFVTKDSLSYGLGVMALYMVIQFVENNFISPIILGNSVNVNPFVAILALLVMNQYWGVIGMLIAVPLTATMVILLEHSDNFTAVNVFLKNDT